MEACLKEVTRALLEARSRTSYAAAA